MTAPPPRNRAKLTGYLLLAAGVVFLDQLSKQAAVIHLSGQPPVEILPFFRLTLVFNRGAAFGFLGDAGGWQHYFLGGLAVVISLALLCWLWRVHARDALLSWGLALVLGGAVGNLTDRIIQQQVIDFILLHYRNWYFPAFNLADGAITLGALALIIDNFTRRAPAEGG